MSSSVPSPYVRARFGLLNILGATDGCGLLGVRVADRADKEEGGRGGNGDELLAIGEGIPDDMEPDAAKTEDRVGLDLWRRIVGMVKRTAAALEDGVVGRVGGTL